MGSPMQQEAKVLTPRPYETPGEIIGQFTGRAPVDLEGMAAALGIEVVRTFLGPEIAGRIERTPPGRYRISLNLANSEKRQRFTLAHEIAHYALHRDMIGDGITDSPLYRSGLSTEIERQANRYAAVLLMPPALVRHFWNTGCNNVDLLAGRFNVSRDAAAIRLSELGYAVAA